MRFIEEPGLTANIQTTYPNFVELACSRANEKPDQTAYVFLQDGENESGRLTFAELDRRARAIAARLQSMGMTGERALLLYLPGLDYIEGFFGCLYAGVVAVPASPPTRRQQSRLLAVINDAAPAVIMTTTNLAAKIRNEFACGSDVFVAAKASSHDEGVAPTIPGPVWFATDKPEAAFTESWVKPALNPDSLAFLQYTSGSTGDPKGVMVSHGNLMSNQEAIKQGFGHTEHNTVVGWLPLYHDMGLIGNLLQPLYLGATAILMPPMAFLEKPIRWLRAVSNYQANTSGGPNFAYDLCLRKVTAEQMQGLDLTAWTLAFNGSEPVRAATMDRFAEMFAGCGFRRESFFPCYGLAEATLFVSGERLPSVGCTVHTGRNQEVRSVACGSTSDYHEIRIVDPETGSLCQEGHIGEIQVAGPSIAKGYWNRLEESEQTFRARLADKTGIDHPVIDTRSHEGENNSQPFLRTGDLGFLDNDLLYITGRIKDLIIIRGRNFYPQDIEQALTEEIPAFIPDSCVAFSITYEDEEQLIMVAEITRAAMRSGDYEAIAAAVRKVLAEVCELAAAELVLVQPGTVPKTSSGKIRRQPCKQMYLENSLPVLFRSGDQTNVKYSPVGEQAGLKVLEESSLTPSPEYQILQQALLAVPQAQRALLIGRFLKHKIARLLKVEESLVSTDSPLRSLGLDSLKAVELKHATDELLGIDAPLSLFLSDDSLEKIAEKLSETTESTDGCAVHTDPSTGIEQDAHSPLYNSDLSSTQFSMWTMQQLEPNSIVYNLHLALRIEGEVNQKKLRQAFRYLTDRHTMLRTLYHADANDEIIQQVLPTSELPDFFTAIDASAWPESQLQDDMAWRAREPFDLATGPLLRITCYAHGMLGLQNDPLSSRGGNKQSLPTETCNTLLICAHHITVDLWSVLILVSELKTIYAELSSGRESLLNNLNSSYTDFVAWQRQYLKSPACAKAWNYWQRQLTGELPLLSLPTDRPRPTVSDYRGASVAFRLNRDETEQLKKLAGQQGVTLFALLLTAYKVLLHRYTHQKDLIVGVPTSGRSQARFTPVVGNFVNPLPLRSYPSGNKPFSAYLAEVNDTLLSALEYQDFLFSLMVERLQPERVTDHWPIYQTLFVLQQAQADKESKFAQLALGEDGTPLSWGNWRVRPRHIQQRVENFDLKLMAAETEEGLMYSFQYRRDLFDEDTVTRWGGHFGSLLKSLPNNPGMPLGDLPLMSIAEQQRIVKEWNTINVDFQKGDCIHRLFEAQVEQSPNATAVSYEDRWLTYQELNERANHLAHYLQDLGVKPETLVGICMERSLELVVGVIGILKAGGVYIPLDPIYPKERLALMLEDAKAPILLTQQHLETKLPDSSVQTVYVDRDWPLIVNHNSANPTTMTIADHLAYVIYTSGSTGRPKGVSITHRNVTRLFKATQTDFGFRDSDVWTLFHSYAFDFSVWELWGALLHGGKLVVVPHWVSRSPEELNRLLREQAITVLNQTPSSFYQIANLEDEGSPPLSLRWVIFGGEDLEPRRLREWFRRLGDKQPCLINMYGITETTVHVTLYGLCREDCETMNSPIGRPISDLQAYLLDARLNLVPVGLQGELYIGGAGLARGYLNSPELTASRFIPNPFGEAGSRLYKSGDLARYRPDGTLEFLGRADRQVKIRGFRIELGEINTRLRQHTGIREGVVIVREDSPGEKRLVVYWVPRLSGVNGDTGGSSPLDQDETLPTTETLRTFLKETIPDYMIPAAFVQLDRFPVTLNGKLDIKSLPEPDISRQFIHQYVAPRNSAEESLATLWAEVLRVEQVGIHDNFFALGGDSILSVQLASRAYQAGWSITPRLIFQHQTVAELAEYAETSASKNEGAVTTDRYDREDVLKDYIPFSLADLDHKELEALLSQSSNVQDLYPLSPMQEGMLFHTLARPGSGIYVMQDRYEIRGTVDAAFFEAAWQQVVDNQPILRTSFVWDTSSRPHQIVHRRVDLSFEYSDWSDLTDSDRQRRLNTLLQGELENGFDLECPPLFRIRLVRCGTERYLCIRSYHHILMDEWCTSPMLMEFRENYAALLNRNSIRRETSRSFRDYVAWLERQDEGVAESFWRRYLEGFAELTPLVVDCTPALGADTGNVVEDTETKLSTVDTKALNALVHRYQLTVNTVVQACWAILLSRYSGNREVLFGVTVAGRPTTLTGVENMLGLFINALPLRVQLPWELPVVKGLRELLAQNLELRQYEHSSLVQVQSWSDIPRSQAPLFQHLVTFENAPVDPSLLNDKSILDMRFVGNRVHTNYPLTLVAIPGERLSLRITYEQERFELVVVRRMLGHLKTLLEDMIRHPEKKIGELNMLDPSERGRMLLELNRTDHAYPEPTDFVKRFEAQVERTPEAIALAFQGERLTYRELNARANRLAHGLIDQGIGPDVIVALLNDRGIDYATMMLGVFKAGGAYLPLDPSHPDGRIAQVLKESKVGLILTGTSYFERVLALAGMVGDSMATSGEVTYDAVAVEQTTTTQAYASLSVQLLSQPDVLILDELESSENQVDNPPKRHTPDSLAFVIFTSGSTGMPKGAMVEHKGMFNNLITKVPTMGLTERDVIAQTAGQCFDISVWQHLTALVCGARVEIFPDEIVKEPNQLLAQLTERGITILEAVPSMIQALSEIADEAIELPNLRWLIACGEVFPPELCRRWMDRFPHVRVLNAYGPAECSDDVSYYEVPARPGETEAIVPIGRPVHNTHLYLLDRWLEPLPIGVPGEICVAGIQVGRGYLNRPDLTAEKFIPDPFDNEGTRLYRTGDLGRYRENGAIEFLGRIDHQVKIRGVRIEPGEIEAQLLTFPKLEQALVTVRENGASGKRLVAYVVCGEVEISSDAELIGKLRDHLSARLPNAMMPSAFVRLDTMPLSANGKIDRKALPEPDMAGQSERAYVAPRNPAEEALADIWKEVLGLERVGVTDNFFELGGHSLLAMQVLSRIRRAFGVEVPLRRLFEASTIEALALLVEEFLIEHLNSLSEEEAEALLIDDEEGVSMSLKQQQRD